VRSVSAMNRARVIDYGVFASVYAATTINNEVIVLAIEVRNFVSSASPMKDHALHCRLQS
jgi:hypothetical protein